MTELTADEVRAMRGRERAIVRSAALLVPTIMKLIPATRSALEVGCGSAAWLSLFERHGVSDVVGIDGKRHPQLHIADASFVEHDLSQPFTSDRRFDLALSLDIAERLPADRAPGFVDDLCRTSDIVLFCAATPSGKSIGANNRWPSYWSRLFEAAGYACVDCLRPLIWADSRIDWRYAQGLLCFVKAERLAGLPLLNAAATLPAAMRDLVHPEAWPARALIP